MLRLVLIAAAVSMASCESVNQAYVDRPGVRASQINKIESGMSIGQVTELLGPYDSYSNLGDGSALYQWIETRSYGAKHLALLFENGGFVEVQHYYSGN